MCKILCSMHLKSSFLGCLESGLKASHTHKTTQGKQLSSRQECALSAPLFNSPACFYLLPIHPMGRALFQLTGH